MVIDGLQTKQEDIAQRLRPMMQDSGLDRLFLCHGFASHFDRNKDKARLLGKIAAVDGITVDYTCPPGHIFASFESAIRAQGSELLVGTSMGGFFAAWLGAELNIPFVALNPAVAPAQSLRKYIGEGDTHFGTRYSLNAETVDAYANLPFRTDGRGCVALDMGDEVIDPHHTLNCIGDALPVLIYPGGSHRFDHLPELTSVISAL